MNESDNLLITAMMLLEMQLTSLEDHSGKDQRQSLLWSVHELVQRAWSLSRDGEAQEISAETNELLAALHTQYAIQDAADSSARGAI